MRISRNSEMRRATSSTDETSSAISIRRMLAKALISTGIGRPLGFSNSSAGPPDLHAAIGELGDLEHRVDFEGDALQLFVLFEGAHELAQVVVSHNLNL